MSGCLYDRAARPSDAGENAAAPLHTATPELPASAPPETTADLLVLDPPEKYLVVLQEQEEPNAAKPAEPPPPPDLWDRIRDGFALPDRDHARLAGDIAWFQRHPAYINRVVDRAEPYLHLIVEQAEARGVPLEIALLPVIESAFQPFAYSHGRAAGLWQFIPATGRRYGLQQTWWYDGRRDVAESTRAALDYLQYLNRFFDGDWLLALAAYNAGEGTVRRAVRRNQSRNLPTDYWHLDSLPRETRAYVPKLLAFANIIQDPDGYGLEVRSLANEPYLTTVNIGSQIDLDLAAELADLTLEAIYRYNPGFNRWATDPEGPHRLLLPLDKAPLFEERLAAMPASERIQWQRHRIGQGETLGTIAQRYRTTVTLLKQVNGLRSSTIRAGDNIIIPVARRDLSRYRLSEEQRRQAVQNRERDGHRVEHVVRSGDTLWGIARQYGVTVNQLASWNGMAPRDPLRQGRRLVIWTSEARAEAQNVSSMHPANFTHPHMQSMQQRIGYTVRQGDSLARISQRFRVSVADLQRWNGINAGSYLQPGQRLVLYVDVSTQSGVAY